MPRRNDWASDSAERLSRLIAIRRASSRAFSSASFAARRARHPKIIAASDTTDRTRTVRSRQEGWFRAVPADASFSRHPGLLVARPQRPTTGPGTRRRRAVL